MNKSSRKTHTKSKKGCLECKRRHNKCDEKKPICSNCIRLDEECHWPTKVARGVQTSVNSSVATTTIAQSPSPLPDSAPKLNISDLELLHHYCLFTYGTLETVENQCLLYRDYIVRLGFKHQCVMRAIFSITALHLATLKPSRSAYFVSESSIHYNCGLAEFRTIIQNLTVENSPAAVAFSCLTVLHAFAVAQVKPSEEPITDLVACLFLIRGVGLLIRPYWLELLNTEIEPVLTNGRPRGVQGHVSEIAKLKELIESLTNQTSPTVKEDYMKALEALHRVIIEVQNIAEYQSMLGVLFSWAVELSDDFMASFPKNDPTALVLLAYFAAMFPRDGSVWWLGNWNLRIIGAVEERIPMALHPWLEWPKILCGIQSRS